MLANTKPEGVSYMAWFANKRDARGFRGHLWGFTLARILVQYMSRVRLVLLLSTATTT